MNFPPKRRQTHMSTSEQVSFRACNKQTETHLLVVWKLAVPERDRVPLSTCHLPTSWLFQKGPCAISFLPPTSNLDWRSIVWILPSSMETRRSLIEPCAVIPTYLPPMTRRVGDSSHEGF
jgi:hypothetical protein